MRKVGSSVTYRVGVHLWAITVLRRQIARTRALKCSADDPTVACSATEDRGAEAPCVFKIDVLVSVGCAFGYIHLTDCPTLMRAQIAELSQPPAAGSAQRIWSDTVDRPKRDDSSATLPYALETEWPEFPAHSFRSQDCEVAATDAGRAGDPLDLAIVPLGQMAVDLLKKDFVVDAVRGHAPDLHASSEVATFMHENRTGKVGEQYLGAAALH